MIERRHLASGILSSFVCLSSQIAVAQQSEPPVLKDPKANPISPDALQAAPLFGESGPARPQSKPSLEDGLKDAERLPADANAEWKPKFSVGLITLMDAVADDSKESDTPFLQLPENEPKPKIQKTTAEVQSRKPAELALLCDDINVEANVGQDGKLTYSFSCQGKAVLTIAGSTITGTSISSSNGIMTIRDGVIELNNGATIKAENLQLMLPIHGVRVNSASEQQPAVERLKPSLTPVPDPISNERSFFRDN